MVMAAATATGMVRPLRADDRPQWRALWHDYLVFYETTIPDEVYETTWQRLLTPNVDPFGLCAADEDDRLLGILHYLFHVTCWSVAPKCYLQDLFVADAARGRGVGRALMAAAYEAADRHGVCDVYWTTQHFNHTARKLYDQVGVLTPFIKYKRPPAGTP